MAPGRSGTRGGMTRYRPDHLKALTRGRIPGREKRIRPRGLTQGEKPPGWATRIRLVHSVPDREIDIERQGVALIGADRTLNPIILVHDPTTDPDVDLREADEPLRHFTDPRRIRHRDVPQDRDATGFVLRCWGSGRNGLLRTLYSAL
jgi:hypothetical protein